MQKVTSRVSHFFGGGGGGWAGEDYPKMQTCMGIGACPTEFMTFVITA